MKIHDELDKIQKQKTCEISKSDLKSRVINTMDRELVALRGGRKVSDPFGNQSQSVKNLIASIEQSVKTGTPPLSPIIASECSSRRNSMDSTISLSSLKSESPTKSGVDRRGSMPVESQYKSLKRSSDHKEQRPPLSHRHTITNIIYDKAPPVVDDTKVSPPGRADTPDSGKKPFSGILSSQSSKRKSNTL